MKSALILEEGLSSLFCDSCCCCGNESAFSRCLSVFAGSWIERSELLLSSSKALGGPSCLISSSAATAAIGPLAEGGTT